MSCPSAAAIAQLVEGGLADPARLAIERHLDGCAACGELVAELAWVVAPPHTTPPRYRLVGQVAGAWLADDLERGERVELVFVADPDGRIARTSWRPFVEIVDSGSHGGESYLAIRAGDALARATLGAIAATDPAYRAPEVLHGVAPSAASDQFALCVGLWEARVGRRPFAGATPGALAVAMQAPLAIPKTLPPQVFAALRRGLDPDPAKRWPDLAALAEAMARPEPRRWPFAMLAVAAIVVVCAIAFAVL
ncbi:MAG TPA: zf-HC2 domain-containing protein [Kofleriaceae bacterium]